MSHTNKSIKKCPEILLAGFEPTTPSQGVTYPCLRPLSHQESYVMRQWISILLYLKNRSTLDGLQGQEWPRMDTNLAVSLYSVFNASPESSGIPIFSSFSEIGDLRQAKTKNSDEIWSFLSIWKVIFIFPHWIYILKLVLKKGIRLRVSNSLMNFCSFSRRFEYLLVVCAFWTKILKYILSNSVSIVCCSITTTVHLAQHEESGLMKFNWI